MKLYGGKKNSGAHSHAADRHHDTPARESFSAGRGTHAEQEPEAYVQGPRPYNTDQPARDAYTTENNAHARETNAYIREPVSAPTRQAVPVENDDEEYLPRKKSRRGLKIAIIILAVIFALLLALIVYAVRFIKPPEPIRNPNHGTTTAVTQGSTTTSATSSSAGGAVTTEATSTTEQKPDAEKTEDELLEELAAMATDIDVSSAKQREGVFTILIVGTDMDGIRTDTIVMATLDTNNKTVAMLNVPRDTMSASAAGKIHKINAAFNKGIKRTITEVTNLLGYEANRYVIVDYDAFENLIDAIGGVEINVPKRMYYHDPDQNLTIDLQPGLQVLDGHNALDYMRFRKGYANQDLGRIEAQQGVYKAVIQQMATPATLLKIPALAEVFFENVETNLSIGEIIWLGTQFYDMNTDDIITATIPTYLRSYNNQSYVVASTYKMLNLINESFNPNETAITNVSVITPPATTKATTGEGDEPVDPDDPEATGTSAATGSGEGDEPPAWLGGGDVPVIPQDPAQTTGADIPVPPATGVVDVPAVTTPADVTPPPTAEDSEPPAWLG